MCTAEWCNGRSLGYLFSRIIKPESLGTFGVLLKMFVGDTCFMHSAKHISNIYIVKLSTLVMFLLLLFLCFFVSMGLQLLSISYKHKYVSARHITHLFSFISCQGL